MNTRDFSEHIWQKYSELFREMPWRTNTDPYAILVSEVMLQQTQVDRVIPKFDAFLQIFPNTKALASAPLAEVLGLWSGLGYNRRAKFLHQAAQKIETDFSGVIPKTIEELVRLPGVGVNTAAAILNYAFEIPTPYIETNIRTVFFYHFFNNQDGVSDKILFEKVKKHLDYEHPREYHWALMDYGAFLKRNGVKNNSQSIHHKKQKKLAGSIREMRGKIIKVLIEFSELSEVELQEKVVADERFSPALNSLQKEKMIQKSTHGNFHLTK